MRKKNSTRRSKEPYGPPGPGRGDQGGPGFRSRRLAAARRNKKRRLTRAILTIGIILAVAVFLAVLVLMRARGPSPAEEAYERSPDDSGSGNVIMLVTDESGRLSQLLLLTREAQGGFSLYLIPSRTVVEAAEAGFKRLDKVYEENGQGATDQAVADLLQVPVQYHINFTYQSIEFAAGQAGTINFKTGTPLTLNKGPGGMGAVAIPAGENPTGSSMALRLFKASAEDNQDGPRVQAVFFQGIRDALATKTDIDRKAFARQLLGKVKTDLDEDDFINLIVDATTPGRAVGVFSIPVKAVAQGPDWYFEPVTAELKLLLEGSSQDSSYRLEVQNGTESQDAATAAAARLQPLRYSISVKPEPSGVNFDTTQIRCGSEAIGAANRIRDLLGQGVIIKDEVLEKRQIIVIIGRDMQ